ncbi:MAG TPA: efflux RND transporter periplasmic adaptor subunit [Longimicrobium sp.]|nr:efflux RND transporter periplasmic adaptor subunit [Longimicrobium sp.]
MKGIRSLAAKSPALLLALAAAACGREASGEEAPPPDVVAVRLAPVTEEWVTRPVEVTGTLQAKDEIELSFKVGGIVSRVLVAEGQPVRRGQALATLDLREIDATVGRARSAADKAERDLARARALYADSVATLEQMQDAATGAEVARNDLAAAAFNRRYATILAPADGTVLRRFAEGGELVSPGAPVLVLGSSERGQVLRVGLADRDAVRVRPGDAASVSFDAFPGEAFRGTVREVGAAADPRTGTYEVEVAVEPNGKNLISGLVGRAEIRPKEGSRMRVVPIEAVLEADGDRATVYTVDAAGRARRRAVTVGFIQGSRVAIAGGIDGAAKVVTDGAAYLSDGAAVKVVP